MSPVKEGRFRVVSLYHLECSGCGVVTDGFRSITEAVAEAQYWHGRSDCPTPTLPNSGAST